MLYDKVHNILETYQQLHLLKYYDELNNQEKEQLLQQISLIDFQSLNLLLTEKELAPRGTFDPIDTLSIDDINKNKNIYYQLGVEAIKSGKVGAVLLAGGQGTRLGFDKPKGTLNVGLTKTLYLFEVHIQNLLKVVEQAGNWISLFIMTSEKNKMDTIDFFEQNNYFGYNKTFITFFTQEMAPSVDYSGKVLLEDKGMLSLSPNGNGGWFSSLAKAELLKKINSSGTQWLNVFSVDNVLQKIADPYFIGATIEANCVSGAKVVRKATPEEKVGVLCLEGGKPSIVEYYEMPDEMLHARKDNGELSYNYGVILNYLFQVKELEKIMHTPLPVHIVEKKIPYLDEDGNYINPEVANGYKFETLVLDMIRIMPNCLSYEVARSKEFAPIKNKTGIDSLDTARELLNENGVSL